jgi:hypothetical protein
MGKWKSALFVLGFGALFMLIGIGVGVVLSANERKEATRVAELPVVVARSLEDRQFGTEILAEGWISPRNQPIFREFVSYYREEYQGTDEDDNEQWREDERQTPALRMDLADGTIRVANTDYQLTGALHQWQESNSLRWNIFSGGTKRYRGLIVNQGVIVIGSVVPGNEGPEVYATTIAVATRNGYIAAKQQGAQTTQLIGIIFAGVGALLIVIGAGIALRVARP